MYTKVLTHALARGGPILEIMELRIHTKAYYHYLHCAFAVRFLRDGWWVFDPTGVQFGPDWPLLSPLVEYLDRSRSGTVYSWHPLGTSAGLP